MQPAATELDTTQVMTLEAFADTMVPGRLRWPDDRAVAGAADGGGAVECGAVALMASAEGGLGPMLENLVVGLNDHAISYAGKTGLTLDESVPPFVALGFDHRTALVSDLVSPDNAEQEMWVALAMFSFMAWDTGASKHTIEAIADGHPGLTTIGFTPPDADGLWRFPEFSYRRALSPVHPQTTPLGDPA
jgi:hypothetical protein